MKQFLSILFLIYAFASFAQEQIQISPDGIFDKVFTQDGTQIHLKDLFVDGRFRDSLGLPEAILIPCSSGYFNLYYEVGSGMEGNSALEIARRNVLCQVFSDLSQFIVNPNPNTKVNILVGDIDNSLSGYNPSSNPNPAATSGVLGMGTGFYVFPTGAPNYGGIIDNQIWKTLNSGIDAYTNVASPLYSTSVGSSAGGLYFHGEVSFNFSNPIMNWHLNLAQQTPSGLLDFYTVALHEVTHALGFISLINSAGNSVFGASNNYYSRYDLFLTTQANQNLITNNGNSCSMYDYSFNPQLNTSLLTPSVNVTTPNAAACSSQLKFAGNVNQLTFTPSSFQPGSSLSHFEDQCHLPVGSGYANDQYYLMSNSSSFGPNFMKRFLKPEERRVLCDLGYKVKTTFGNSANFNFVNYGGSQCAGLDVVGINDGIIQTGPSAGSFQYITTVGAAPLLISGVCTNDWNTVSFECLQNLYNNGTTNVTSGTNFTFTATAPGIAVLRYIPVSSSGKRGNITYIYIYIKSANCNPSPCSFLNNAGFESATTCGQIGNLYPPVNVDCWIPFMCTPDLYKRNCTNPSSAISVSMNVPVPWTVPTTDSWNGTPNNTFIGLWSTGGPANETNYNESIQTMLNSPLVNGNSYTISFRYKVKNVPSMTIPSPPYPLPVGGTGKITIAGSSTLLAPLGTIQTTTFPSSINQLGVPITVTNDNAWHFSTQTFIYNGSQNLNNLIIINSSNMNTLVNQPTVYVYIDDVNLTEVNPATALTFPDILCINQNIADMSIYAPVPGGTFSGSGVSSSSGIFSFNSTVAGVGTHIITYTYTTINGCVLTIYDQIQVVSSSLSATASALPQTACVGQTVTLSGSSVGATSFTWNPGNISGNTFSTVFSVPTLYTLTVSNSAGCVATASVQVNAATPATITVTPTTSSTCPGQQVTLAASGANSYSWSPNVALSTTVGSSVVASPNATQTYTVTGTNASGCTASVNSTVTVLPCTDCMSGSGAIWSGTITNQTPTANSTVRIPNNISISGTVNLNGNNVKIMSNVIITVLPNSTLNINGAHLYACDKMWQGIVVQPGGKVNIQPYIVSGSIQKTTLIEDAIVALNFAAIASSQSTAVLQVNNATFNKNATAIRIQGYPFANASTAFSVKNSLFTCRGIYNSTLATWPQTTAVKVANNNTNQLLPPYINTANGLQFLKAPMNSTFSETGIQLINVGSTIGSTSFTYNSITIGSAVAAEYNVFDNVKIGINALNTNLRVINTTFQYPQIVPNGQPISGNGPDLATGIHADVNNGTNYKLDVAGTTAQPNRFYGWYRAVRVNRYRNIQFNNNTIRSNRQNAVAQGGGSSNGRYGLYLLVENYDNVSFANNTVYNINQGVYLNCSASFNSPTVLITNNIFKKDFNTTTLGAFAADAIYLVNVNSTSNISGSLFVNNNSIVGSYRGITLDNWNKTTTQVNNNTITLGGVVSSSPSHGIALNTCSQSLLSQIFNNSVTGFSQASAVFKGIAFTSAGGNDLRCNTVNNTYSGLYFNGFCSPTKTFNNSMQNHKYGFVLDNNAIIGTQGSTSSPADNRWLGTWASGNFKNACLNFSSTLNSPMYVRVTTVGNSFSPNGSVYNGFSSYPYSLSVPQTLFAAVNPPMYVPCAAIMEPPGGVAEIISALEFSTDTSNASANTEEQVAVLNKTYRTLDADSTLMQNSLPLTTFYAAQSNSNTAMLLEVEKAISDENTTLAETLNTAIISENNLEESYKLFYDAYLNFLDGAFTENDSLVISEIASGCPTLLGGVVFQATALYNAVYGLAEVFDQICPEYLDRSQQFEDEQLIENKSDIEYQVYPIPNNGEFKLRGIIEKGYKIEILSIDGKSVYQQVFNTLSKEETIKTTLQSGTYTVNLSNCESISIYKEKIVILN